MQRQNLSASTKSGALVLLLGLLSGCASSPPVADLQALIVSRNGLHVLSLTPGGVDTPLPAVTPAQTFYDLARHPGSKEVLAATHSGLQRIDIVTGVTQPVGSAGAPPILNALAFTPDGRLFGGDEFGYFYRIESTTGHITRLNDGGPGAPYAGDLAAAPDGTMYATIAGSPSNKLVTVDLATGQQHHIGTTGFDEVLGLTFKGSDLYGITRYGEVLSIDHQSGRATLIRETAFRTVVGMD